MVGGGGGGRPRGGEVASVAAAAVAAARAAAAVKTGWLEKLTAGGLLRGSWQRRHVTLRRGGGSWAHSEDGDEQRTLSLPHATAVALLDGDTTIEVRLPDDGRTLTLRAPAGAAPGIERRVGCRD